MSEALWCTQGHRWDPPPGFADAALLTCPICGAPPEPQTVQKPWSRAGKSWCAWFVLLAAGTFALIILLVVLQADFGFFPIFIGLPLVWVLSLVFWGSWYAERQRMLAMAETCLVMNFTFTDALKKPQFGSLPEFNLFKRGHSQKAVNLMHGQIGGSDVTLMDFRYTTGSGKHQQTHKQTVVLLHGAAAGLPDFELTSATFWDKLSKLFGAKHLEFAEMPEFSRAYRVKGAVESAIREVFTPELRRRLLEDPGWAVETHAGHMLLHRAGERCKPEACPQLVAEAMRLRLLFAPAEADRGKSESA